VIYLYYQLAKKFRSELVLTDVRFDVRRRIPPVLAQPQGGIQFAATPPYRQILDLQVVSPPPPWSTPAASELARPFAAAFARPSPATATIAQLPPVSVPHDEVEVLRLTRAEAAARIVHEQDIQPSLFTSALDRFLALPINKIGARATYEYCVATDGLYVEANVSPCAVCDEAPCQETAATA
jgi:hypothetical protein